jgi:hypothetical protein
LFVDRDDRIDCDGCYAGRLLFRRAQFIERTCERPNDREPPQQPLKSSPAPR